jgi:thiamine biosynthesis lipoprotein
MVMGYFLKKPGKNIFDAIGSREYQYPWSYCRFTGHTCSAADTIHQAPDGWICTTALPGRKLSISANYSNQFIQMIRTTEFKAMGCRIFAAIDSPRGESSEALQSIPRWFEGWEQSFSRFRPDSELNEVNRSAGKTMRVSKAFWEVMKVAKRAEHDSGNLITPAIHDQLVAAGYDTSFDDMSTNIQGATSMENTGAFLLSDIQTEAKSRSIRLPFDSHLDFGGVAKGWAAHQTAKRLESQGSALVNAGGDIAITGKMADGTWWSVGVADPVNPSSNLEILRLGRCGVATSGTDFRRWKKDGVWQHHIIDPRTGLPAMTDILSATVIAPDVMDAEMNAKVAVILGSVAALDWLEIHPSLAGILVLKNGQVVYSQRLVQHLWRTNDQSNQ